MPINMVQSFSVEVDSNALLLKYLDLAMRTVLCSRQEIAVKAIDYTEESLAQCLRDLGSSDKDFPIVLIDGSYLSKEGKNSYFNGHQPWMLFSSSDGKEDVTTAASQYIETVLHKHGKAWGREFRKRFGDGYHDGFNQYDGSVHSGFRLADKGYGNLWLAISIVHIEYSK